MVRNMEAIIGVIGTILGTILGWVLNSISQKGKLNFYIVSWEDKFQHNEHGYMKASSTIQESQTYSCKVAIDIYNSSAETKIMRDVKLVYEGGREVLRKSTPNDYSTLQVVAYAAHYDKVGPINIPPKTIINVVLTHSEWNKENSLADYMRTEKIYIQYLDEKGNEKRVLIKEDQYHNYFERASELAKDTNS